METAAGVRETEIAGGSVTTSCRVAVRAVTPDPVPRTVRVVLPAVADPDAVMVRLAELPPDGIVAPVALTPVGRPSTVMDTAPEKPPERSIDTLTFPLIAGRAARLTALPDSAPYAMPAAPAWRVNDPGVTDMANPGSGPVVFSLPPPHAVTANRGRTTSHGSDGRHVIETGTPAGKSEKAGPLSHWRTSTFRATPRRGGLCWRPSSHLSRAGGIGNEEPQAAARIGPVRPG